MKPALFPFTLGARCQSSAETRALLLHLCLTLDFPKSLMLPCCLGTIGEGLTDWPLLLLCFTILPWVLVQKSFRNVGLTLCSLLPTPHSVSGMPGGRAAKQQSLVRSWMRRKNPGPCKVGRRVSSASNYCSPSLPSLTNPHPSLGLQPLLHLSLGEYKLPPPTWL